MNANTLLEVQGLAVDHVPAGARRLGRGARVRVLEDVSFHVARRETLALVGASGSGKTTLAKALLRLVDPAAGHVLYAPRAGAPVLDLARVGRRALRAVRPDLGIVFQDPLAALNPRLRARSVLIEALSVRGPTPDAEHAAVLALEAVGLTAAHLERFPHELSGGERQRLCLARALATEPRLLVLDEALAALDVSVSAHVANVLVDLRRERALSCLLIAHDLDFVRWFADRVAVLDRGRIVEIGAVDRVLGEPEHPATRALVDAHRG